MEEGKFLIVNHRIRIPLREMTFTYARSSGAGGQNVNKVNSKAILRWEPLNSDGLPVDVRDRLMGRYQSRFNEDGELIIMSDVHRDQGRNVADCLEKLRQMLLSVAVAPKKRIKTKPTRASQKKRVEKKRIHSDKKKGRRTHIDWD